MKRFPVLILLLCLLCCAAAASAESGTGLPDLPDRLPAEYKKQLKNSGSTVEAVTYPSRDYTGDGQEVTKRALVYLPAGYTEEQPYDLLILCHGISGTEKDWGFHRKNCIARNAVDHLIANGEIRPLIIVMPNGRSTAKFNKLGWGNAKSFYTFGQELRNDLLPWIDAHYSTYGSLTPDDPSASREHRYMAGLSMGGMQTINIGMCECLDLFSAFGAFSAAPTSYTASEIASRIAGFDDYPVRFFYSICGRKDSIAYKSAAAAAKDLPEYSSRLTAENWYWHECPGAHTFAVWNTGLYNFLRILGN